MKLSLIVIPFIGGFSGWLIITTALKLMFRPDKPVKIPWGNTYLQGLIPRKKAELAAGIREMIQTQLLHAVTKDSGLAPDIFSKLTDTVAQGIKNRTEQKIPGFLPGAVRERISGAVEDIVRKEAPAFIEAVLDKIRDQGDQEQDFCRMLEDKIQAVDLYKIEESVKKSPEILILKTGAVVVGVAMGFVQLLAAVYVLT